MNVGSTSSIDTTGSREIEHVTDKPLELLVYLLVGKPNDLDGRVDIYKRVSYKQRL